MGLDCVFQDTDMENFQKYQPTIDYHFEHTVHNNHLNFSFQGYSTHSNIFRILSDSILMTFLQSWCVEEKI